MYPTTWHVLCNLKEYGINPNRFDKLFRKHRHSLGERISSLDRIPIKPLDPGDLLGSIDSAFEMLSLKDVERTIPRPRSLCRVTEKVIPPEAVLEPQSGTEFSVSYAPDSIKTTNLKFLDDVSPNMYEVVSSMDETRMGEDTGDVSLGEFFARPVKIYEEEWGTGLALADSFDPWSLFFNNKRVVNRIANFNLLRSKLHLKVVLNGNGFQYGRAILSYNPIDALDSFAPSTLVDQDIVQLSQLPHLYLNPTTSQGGDMVLPFFYHLNNVKQATADYDQLGLCLLKSINVLKHANGASDKVTISIFAWAEDITLAVPTSLDNPQLIPQSGEVDEANMKGVISKPATAVANIAQMASTIPAIAPYAKATEMGARALAGVASAFGYSRPAVTKNPEPFRNFPTSSLALTNVPDNAQKLTVDDKQELTIDPNVSGVASGDVLDIKSIAGRESYLATFDWAVGTAPDTLLWNNRVTPVIWNESGTPTAYHLPACAMAALPFTYWTGTMNFRFQVVASNYHKGRLRISYDPNFFDAQTEFNVNYSHIVDIAEKVDFTVSVTNGQDVSLIDHHYPGIQSMTETWSTTRYTAKEEGNGVLQVTVLNELTVPNSVANNDIQINVFVSAGDDFQVFVPDDYYQYMTLTPQSGEVDMGVADANPLDSEPMHTESEVQDLNGQQIITDKLNLVYTGEKITSFRTMLKRYNLHTTVAADSGFSQIISMGMNSYPYLRGDVNGAIHTTSTLAPYNYCNTVLIHWITMAFAGWRGSIRWKVLPLYEWETLNGQCERGGIRQGAQYYFSVASPPATSSESTVAYNSVARIGTTPINDRPLAGKMGMAYANGTVNPCMEIEAPFYSPARFVPGRVQNWTGDVTQTRYNECLDFRIFCESFTADESVLAFYCATGEDFQTFFFKGLPRMYYSGTPPLPS